MADAEFDIAVVGAGPAGSTSAIAAARQGARVVLLDQATFPRHKACGCCLGPKGLAALERIGAMARVEALGAPRLSRIELACGNRRSVFALPGGVSLSREALDPALHDVARSLGVETRFGERARVSQPQGADALAVVEAGDEQVTAALVLAADGLAGVSTGKPSADDWARRPGGRVGVSAVLDGYGQAGDAAPPLPGVVRMGVARHGYVGRSTLEDGRVVAAAAVDPAALRQGPAEACADILDFTGAKLEAEALRSSDVRWCVTPRLTRRRRTVAHGRVWHVGDAVGYVEPFTGEGMTWALEQGEAAGALAARVAMAEDVSIEHTQLRERLWPQELRRVRRGRSWRCAAVARVLRRPGLLHAWLGVCNASGAVRRVSGRVVQGRPVEGSRVQAWNQPS
ncbi:MAG: FAD-dependent monooxygenase [Planctomycetota bacterium]